MTASQKSAANRSARGARSGQTLGMRGRKAHLHIENSRQLDPVFEATKKRVTQALGRRPWLKGKVKITIGYDGDIYAKAIRTADALFGWQFDRTDLANRAPNLKWVHAHGAGVNHLMPLDWLPSGGVLTNSRGVHGPKADEYTIMAILMLNNRLPRIATNQRSAKWEQLYNTAIAGKTLLIVGVGHVGGGAAKWAKRFGLHVVGIRRSGKPHSGVDEMHRPNALHRLLPKADFVLITAPHTDESHHLIGARELELMKPGAGMINYSRAHLVDYDALRPHLESGRLSAVLDVFDPEPLPTSSPLWRTPNLIITPHSSSDDLEFYTPRTLDLVFANLERLIKGERLLNRVSGERQY